MADEPEKKKKRPPKVKRDPRVKEAIRLVESGMSLKEAMTTAGFSEHFTRSAAYKQTASGQSTADYIKSQVARRMSDARAKAAIHTDSIVGSLVQIMEGSPADILPENEILARARENGVDHLIKKIVITPIKIGIRTRKNTDGTVTASPVIKEKVELEMYSRLDAIGQLRDNFGMKQEPRANQFEETKRQEVEREIQGIMIAENCDEPTAAKMLLENLGDAPQLRVVVEKILKKFKQKAEPKQEIGVH